jgi:hypothetical protein
MVMFETAAFWIRARRLALAVALFTVCISGDAVAAEHKMPQQLSFELDPSKPPPESSSTRNLFRRGNQAYSSGDHVSALVFLYAYLQRNPKSLRNQTHRERVFNAIRLAEQTIRHTFARVEILEKSNASVGSTKRRQTEIVPLPASADPMEEAYESRETIFAMIQTGQTTCWDGDGNEIACAATGQDGDVWSDNQPPTPRFTDNSDGTVKDNATGLIWLKNANCFGVRTWIQALSDVNTLKSGSCSLTDDSRAGDWHLPNRFELESLLEFKKDRSPIPRDKFTDIQAGHYWSSTTYPASPRQAWTVVFGEGGVVVPGNKGATAGVLAVRTVGIFQ